MAKTINSNSKCGFGEFFFSFSCFAFVVFFLYKPSRNCRRKRNSSQASWNFVCLKTVCLNGGWKDSRFRLHFVRKKPIFQWVNPKVWILIGRLKCAFSWTFYGHSGFRFWFGRTILHGNCIQRKKKLKIFFTGYWFPMMISFWVGATFEIKKSEFNWKNTGSRSNLGKSARHRRS